MVVTLLTLGARVHQLDNFGSSVLRAAVDGGHTDAVETLRAAGATLHMSPGQLAIVLNECAARNDGEAIKLWLLAGADPNCQDFHGQTPLHVAATHGAEAVIILLLRQTNIKLEVVDAWRQTPADAARTAGKTDLVALLIGASLRLPSPEPS